MNTHTFQLFFDDEKEFDFPAPKKAAIALQKTYTVDSEGHPVLTPRCNSVHMLEKEVDRLHKELDALLEDAKGKFAESF